MLAYSSVESRLPPDSSIVFLIDGRGSEPGRPVTRGVFAAWTGDSSFMVVRQATFVMRSLRTNREELLTRDSVTIVPVPKLGFDFIIDAHARSGAMSIRTRASDGSAVTRPIMRINDLGVFAPDLRFVLRSATRDPNRIARFDLPDMKETLIVGSVGPINSPQNTISWDGRTLVFCEDRLTSKLVLIENVRP